MERILRSCDTTRLVGLSVDRRDLEIFDHPKIMVPAMSALPSQGPAGPHATATWIVDPVKQAGVVESLVMLEGPDMQHVKFLVLACAPCVQGGAISMVLGLVICRYLSVLSSGWVGVAGFMLLCL